MKKIKIQKVRHLQQILTKPWSLSRKKEKGKSSPAAKAWAVFGCINQNSKKKIRHLHGDLNLDEIKNALRLLSVNGETNLMNLIRL